MERMLTLRCEYSRIYSIDISMIYLYLPFSERTSYTGVKSTSCKKET